MRNIILASLATLALAACNEEERLDIQPSTANTFMDMVWPIVQEDQEGTAVELDTDIFRENYLVVLDLSGSMNESSCSGSFDTKKDAAIDALENWIQMVDADAAVGLVTFYQGVTNIIVEVAPNNHRNFADSLAGLSADGGTPLSSAVAVGYRALESRAFLQNGVGSYKMVVVTDGTHSPGFNPVDNIDWIIANTPIEMYTIGFCIGGNSALNQPGKTIYAEADSPEKLFSGLTNALAETQDFNLTSFE